MRTDQLIYIYTQGIKLVIYSEGTQDTSSQILPFNLQ